jgi:hypothetical protein
MRSIKRVTPREDWSYLHSLAQDELSRMMRRKEDLIDDRSQIFIKQWMPALKELGPQLSSTHLATRAPVGDLIGGLRDLTGWFQSSANDPLVRTKVLFCSALVVACRANPDYSPESLFGYLRFLVASALRERKPGVLGHIAAVVRGETGHADRAHI